MIEQSLKNPNYISLFSGAGIGCFGFKLEGFDCIASVEIWEKRLKFQRFNNKCLRDSGYIEGDLREASVKEKVFKEIGYWQQEKHLKEVDIIMATPPCQGMSVANHKKKNELGRNSLVIESIKFVKEIKPKFFIFENVRAFLGTLCSDVDGKERKIGDVINTHLGGTYNIHYQTLNFKDYGNPSSRTRTLVVGVRKNLWDITPYDVMPGKRKEIKVRDVISELTSLKVMGDLDSNDIYHNFRSYSPEMLNWIKDLREGQTAFDNPNPNQRPHRMVNGKMVFNTNKNGDKYKRWYWDKPGPCIHTRNDILASQSTVHPSDNRVFSIRELMRLMSIPHSFKWSEVPEEKLNALSKAEKIKFLSKEEMNIRQSIGEAVPTIIIRKIAAKIKNFIAKTENCKIDINKLIAEKNLQDVSKLKNYLKRNVDKLDYTILSRLAELSNSSRLENAAYYTRQDVCYSIVNNLPDPKFYKTLRIIEPAVGVGNFLPLLFKKYRDVPEVFIDVVDIDKDSIDILKILLEAMKLPDNFKINFIEDDFLLHKFDGRYDILIGNPPYKKLTKNKKLLKLYKSNAYNKDTNNLFSFFIERAVSLAKIISLVVPKSLTSTPEFNKTRELISGYRFRKIIDYGEKGFKGVKIETISFVIDTKSKSGQEDNIVEIESYIKSSITFKKQDYIFSKEFPYWIFYRDDFFVDVSNKLKFDIFKVFRDRQITKKLTKSSGKVRVLKSRNVMANKIRNINGYDCYIDDVTTLAVGKYLNSSDVVLVPNLTYYPRACFLPPKAIADGSLAILTQKNGDRKVTMKDLGYYNSEEFEKFYAIARNYGTRSLNIDNNSVFFFGVLKEV